MTRREREREERLQEGIVEHGLKEDSWRSKKGGSRREARNGGERAGDADCETRKGEGKATSKTRGEEEVTGRSRGETGDTGR